MNVANICIQGSVRIPAVHELGQSVTDDVQAGDGMSFNKWRTSNLANHIS